MTGLSLIAVDTNRELVCITYNEINPDLIIQDVSIPLVEIDCEDMSIRNLITDKIHFFNSPVHFELIRDWIIEAVGKNSVNTLNKAVKKYTGEILWSKQ